MSIDRMMRLQRLFLEVVEGSVEVKQHIVNFAISPVFTGMCGPAGDSLSEFAQAIDFSVFAQVSQIRMTSLTMIAVKLLSALEIFRQGRFRRQGG